MGDQHEYHLGELIPVTFSYTAKTSGTYLWVGNSGKLKGGYPIRISCSPSAESVSQLPKTEGYQKFEQMLVSACGGAGVGGGIGEHTA